MQLQDFLDQGYVVYKDVPGFGGYKAGTDGSLWSCKQRTGQYQNWHKLSVSANVRGYRLTTVTRGDGTRKVVKVGRLVLEAFLGKSPLLVRHLNDVRDDDRLSNLAYGTCKDNSRDALLNNKILRGEANGYATATESLVRQVRKLKASGCTYREIQELLGVKKSQACHICTGRTWRHVT
jgi:hypothetical protein